jgi:hypothetical protein
MAKYFPEACISKTKCLLNDAIIFPEDLKFRLFFTETLAFSFVGMMCFLFANPDSHS